VEAFLKNVFKIKSKIICIYVNKLYSHVFNIFLLNLNFDYTFLILNLSNIKPTLHTFSSYSKFVDLTAHEQENIIIRIHLKCTGKILQYLTMTITIGTRDGCVRE